MMRAASARSPVLFAAAVLLPMLAPHSLGAGVYAAPGSQPKHLAFLSAHAGDAGRRLGNRQALSRPPRANLLPAGPGATRAGADLRHFAARAHGARGSPDPAPGRAKRGLNGCRAVAAALRAVVVQLATVLARAAVRLGAQLRHFAASLVVFLALSTPLPSCAVSVCLPLPTPSGIARVCVDVGEPSSVAPAAEQAPVPDHLNAQRTPTKSDGTILSRAGIRPFSMLGDAQARIQAAARYRLGVHEALESRAASPATADTDQPQLDDPAIRKALFGTHIQAIYYVLIKSTHYFFPCKHTGFFFKIM